MSDTAFYFFIAFLAVQITVPLLPLLNRLKSKKYRRVSHSYFCWAMKLESWRGYVDITIYNKANGEIVAKYWPEDVLLPIQFRHLLSHPQSVIQLTKHIEKQFQLDKKKHGIRVYMEISVNNRGMRKVVDEKRDFTEEKTNVFGSYDWVTTLVAQRGRE